ncbi:MAG: DNA helicase PriA [Flavobacteriales bacterium]|jgi:DNA-directed RNA polymerase subunit RPC12/RpoP|nr:DNA helicase PriA [Flavobacteriales bacterium]
MQKNEQESHKKHSCKNCGAEFHYQPGSTYLKCGYCGHQEQIEEDPKDEGIQELDLYEHLERLGETSHQQEEISMVKCKECGAEQHIESHMKTLACVFCTSPLDIKDQYQENWILPGAILPFQIDQKKAQLRFQSWAKSRWFAPNKFKKASLQTDQLKGVYTPFWTFDAQMYVEYSGQRGEYYYETETYTVNDENGNSRNETRQVQKVRWYPASGSLTGFVDDTLVNASQKAKRIFPKKIVNWNLQALVPFDRSYLVGFVTEKYTISLKDGHIKAQEFADSLAHDWARGDIGGDTQRISQLNKRLFEETFKQILLPVYISNYRYGGKNYTFYVNGQNGTIHGERPYSFWKIFFTVVFILIVVGIIIASS